MSWLTRPRALHRQTRFEALVRPHLERLYRLAWRFTRSPEDAEDLLQSLLLKLLPQEERIAALDLPGPWLARALYHLYVDETRRQRRADAGLGSVLEAEDALEQLVDETRDSPEQAAERSQREQRLGQALAALSHEHRALIAWHDMEGYTLDELAVSLDVPVGTLKSRLHRGRAHLRALLQQQEPGLSPAPPERIAV